MMPFQPILLFTTNQMTWFYMKCNTRMKKIVKLQKQPSEGAFW